MENTETPSAHTKGPWTIRVVNMTTAVVSERGVVIAADLYDEAMNPSIDEIDANACLIATAPDLLRCAESAANAFRERISCLKDELREDFCDADDINDQIGNYQWLLDQHRKVIAKAKGKAA